MKMNKVFDVKQERLEQGRKLVEKLDEKMNNSPIYKEHRDVILSGDGAIHYIDAINGDNDNDGLSPTTAWRDRYAIKPGGAIGDILVDNERVWIRTM
jgi:hypothetical protein